MLIKSKGLTRRSLLALGGGAAIAPFVPMLSSTSRAAAGSPCRLLIFQMGHGIAYYNMKPEGSENNWDLTPVLEPLADFKDRLVYLGGIDNPAGDNPVHIKHVDCFKTILTGTDQTEGDKTASISIDQLVANEIGDQTAYPSLLSGVYTNARGVSATGYEQELSAETSPAEQFDRLFSDLDLDQGALDKLKADRGSVLDSVRQNLEAIENRVSTEDKIKIERHLDAVRTMEEDLTSLGQVPGGCTIPEDPGVGGSGGYQAVARAHMDVFAAAFACDLTRVSVLNLRVVAEEDPNLQGVDVRTLDGLAATLRGSDLACDLLWFCLSEVYPRLRTGAPARRGRSPRGTGRGDLRAAPDGGPRGDPARPGARGGAGGSRRAASVSHLFEGS